MADKKKISNGSIYVSNCEEKELIDNLSEIISRNNILKYPQRKYQKHQTACPINTNNSVTCKIIKIHQRSLSNIPYSQKCSLDGDNILKSSIKNIRKNVKLQNLSWSNSSQSTFCGNNTESLKDLIIELVSENVKLKRKCRDIKDNRILEMNNKPCKNLSLYSFVRDFKTGSYLRVNQADRRKNKLN